MPLSTTDINLEQHERYNSPTYSTDHSQQTTTTSTNLTTRDRALLGFWSLFLNPGHIFKSVFKDAKADNIHSDSPIDAIDNLPLGDREDPAPFTQTEIEKILSAPTRRTQEINMMGFAFWSGLRISELIALAWEDIDLKTGTVNVCRARVNGSYKQTKTKRSTHEVELIDSVIVGAAFFRGSAGHSSP